MMWPFTRKHKIEQPTPSSEPHPALVIMAERADAARNERSNTVAAFVRRMQDLERDYEVSRSLTAARARRNGHSD